MTGKYDSDWVYDYFAASSRDLTPVSVCHTTKVLYVPVSSDPEVTRRCAPVLSDTELQRANRFAKQSDRTLFIQRRAFRCFCAARASGHPQPLAQVTFNLTENGRPYLSCLPNYWFSFSSCRFGFVGAWSSTQGLGIDFEDQTKELETTELAQQLFSVAEARVVQRSGNKAFYKYWGLKEAALKSIGEGLPFGLDAFEFELGPNPRVLHAPSVHGGAKQFSAHWIKGTESCTALVTREFA